MTGARTQKFVSSFRRTLLLGALSVLAAGCELGSTKTIREQTSSFEEPSESVAPAPSQPLNPEVGGSNYVFIDLGRYATQPTPENWASDVKTPVVHYHQYVALVRTQLDKLIASGQKKIALVVWFGGPATPDFSCETWMHTVCPQAGGLMPSQARQNLINMLSEIKSRSFEEVQIRLGYQGTADIHGWTAWNEDIYQSSRGFIFDVVETSELALADSAIRRFYDLGLEAMGHPHMSRSWYRRFLKQIWTEYVASYPLERTIGFSFNHADLAATRDSLKLFDEVGARPPRLGLDVYLDRRDVFRNFSTALIWAGWGRQYPLYIQETYRNDPQIAQEIRSARQDFGLNIRSVMQWPLGQGGQSHTDSVELPFEHYR